MGQVISIQSGNDVIANNGNNSDKYEINDKGSFI